MKASCVLLSVLVATALILVEGQNAAVEIAVLQTIIQTLQVDFSRYEQPLAIRFVSIYSSMAWNCIAFYSNNFMDAFTLTDPVLRVPHSSLHTTQNRITCAFQGAISVASVLEKEVAGPVFETATTNPLNYEFAGEFESMLNTSVQRCESIACLEAIAQDNSFDAITMGHIVGKLAIDYALNDGFNQLGRDGGCQANCRPYRDPTGYIPFNNPFTPFRSLITFQRWEPLLEDDNRGYFTFQQHVAPHIGQTAKFRFLPETERATRVAADPEYSYFRRAEAKAVIERMRRLNDTLKMEIEIFDDKLRTANLINAAFIGNLLTSSFQDPVFPGSDGISLTYERVMHFIMGNTAAEIDGTIIAWKEKVRNDLVRPTTIIKNWGDRKITTWATGEGVREFPAKDFEAYIRVMPHSEYVSGSACICQGFSDYWLKYMETIGVDPTFPVQVPPIKAGESSVEPNITPANDLNLSYRSVTELARTCGRSRLDGGMHFEASVPNAYNLCEGIGTNAADVAFSLLNAQP